MCAVAMGTSDADYHGMRLFLPSPILVTIVDASEGLVNALGSTLVSLGRFAEASRMLLHFKQRPSIELSGSDGVDREPFKLLLRCGEWEEARLVVRRGACMGSSRSANDGIGNHDRDDAG